MKTYNVMNDVVLKKNESGKLDLTSQPMDDLDRACLEHILAHRHQEIHALDIGGGAGKHSIRMAQAGAKVTLIDRKDPSHNIEKAIDGGAVSEGAITTAQEEFTAIDPQILAPYHILYSQRALNYLPYKEFMRLLTDLTTYLACEGKLYLSVSGFDNEFGKTLDMRDNPLPTRYGLPDHAMRRKHKIYTPTLIFKKEELEDIILSLAYTIEKLSVSTFGNIKVRATKS